jgi:hypothetical protein
MTDERWAAADRPDPLIAWLVYTVPRPALPRRMRLFCRACCARILPRNPPPAYLYALDLMAEFADAGFSEAAGWRFSGELACVPDDLSRIRAFAYSIGDRFDTDRDALRDEVMRIAHSTAAVRGGDEALQQANLAREIFRGPGPEVVIDPRWLTSAVVDLARAAYEGNPRLAGGYLELPILADALMDAGCDDEPLLLHLRQQAPHVRGCWALDLVLGKE